MKDNNIKVRIDSQEKGKVEKFCAINGITISQYIRNLITQIDDKTIQIITPQELETFENITYELQKIGTNINQIAYYFNLEHVRLLDNFHQIQDILMIDKCKNEQLNGIKNTLTKLKIEMKNLTTTLSNYDKK